MGRWFRHPKRIDLRPFVCESGCIFLFESASFTAEQVEQVRAACRAAVSENRIESGKSCPEPGNTVLFVASSEHCIAAAADALRWRAIIIADPRQGIDSIVEMLTRTRRYRIANKPSAWVVRREPPRFVLDLNSTPAYVSVLPELQADQKVAN